MDTTEIIILTTIFNIIMSGLIGGIVIYTLQKKIDATIQKSLFEHQTKFTRSYEKTVETLENLCKKLAVCARGFREMAVQAVSFYQDIRKELNVDVAYYENNRLQLEDFFNYLEENRYALPGKLVHQITSIYINVNNLHQALPIALPFYDFNNRWELIRLFLIGTPLDSKVNWEQPDFPS